ncbi:hypothetical protein PoB_005825100 [Plakobranchus ocellatus]|uniref:Secreted protein n=1 Tax=Plakobranchus ocellatus TaxID=259542 RepID=A0AAV4CG22_9GAST|nr:hypothetical protein PoB_005825100 [Plakobranchus ocellatus]
MATPLKYLISWIIGGAVNTMFAYHLIRHWFDSLFGLTYTFNLLPCVLQRSAAKFLNICTRRNKRCSLDLLANFHTVHREPRKRLTRELTLGPALLATPIAQTSNHRASLVVEALASSSNARLIGVLNSSSSCHFQAC